MVEGQITVYGTRWCSHSRRSRQLLEQHGVDYQWVDIDQDSAARDFVQETNQGFRSVPTIVFPDGSILVEPSQAELLNKLGV